MDLIKIGEGFYNTARIRKVEFYIPPWAKPGATPEEHHPGVRLHFLDEDPGVLDLNLEQSRRFWELTGTAGPKTIRILRLAPEPIFGEAEDRNGPGDLL